MNLHPMKQRLIVLFGLCLSVVAGCGGGGSVTFYGEGTFARSSSPTVAPFLTTSEVTLRHGGRGTSELELFSGCSIRVRAGRVIGTQRCEINTPAGSVQLNFQDGSWGVTESLLGSGGDGCDSWRYEIAVDAVGTVRSTGGAASYTFRGFREETVCNSAGYVDDGPWIWVEGDDYSGDVYDDWESEYDDYGDDGYYDDGDYGDDWEDDYPDDGGYDDGGYDDGGYDDGGDDGDDDGDDTGGYAHGRRVRPTH